MCWCAICAVYGWRCFVVWEVKRCATITAIANQKGGVGKMMTCGASLASGLVREGKKVLLVDHTRQASLTISLGTPQPDKLPITLVEFAGRVLRMRPFIPARASSATRRALTFCPPTSHFPAWKCCCWSMP